ncbi:Uncharacterised protein [Bordetella pertussis]|nr:Uncharacterised protein [Bordetella pertussis]CFP70610.1 Uncharacterised protein [Bordetella pertussis]CFW37627.1 Uncharacterised protein [Bordetella pertussis]CPM58482.1 Uncharacterised protein [Bordetella pertussis]CPO20139.1 Uncharacterised protein [Bordetella pertussis]
MGPDAQPASKPAATETVSNLTICMSHLCSDV